MTTATIIRPQRGPQERFLSTPADIAIYGGAAGGGKTFGLLMEPLRHVQNGRFGAVIFRRTTNQIRATGGLLSESEVMYVPIGATLNQSNLRWTFPTGSTITFAHMEHEKNRYDWQGSQIALLCFDELTHFLRTQFFYMLSRNRSTCGVRPYVRATCNPVPKEDRVGGWIHEFLGWYLGNDGLPIPERAGVVRWFVVDNDVLVWASSAAELREQHPELIPKSFTFIPASVYDNKRLLDSDPAYLANLMALPYVERERLLGGNWLVKPASGRFFNRAWFKRTHDTTLGLTAADITETLDVCFWDFAATAKELGSADPDYTAGCWMRRTRTAQGDLFLVMATVAWRMNPAEGERAFLATVKAWHQHAPDLRVRWEQEPGSAAKRESHRLRNILRGAGIGNSKGILSRGDKLHRALPFAVAAEAGDVYILEGDGTERWLTHMHHQPDWPHDDEMDAAAGSYNELLSARTAQIK